jgi:myo-inositol 2-dehydrogenase / D-chiro-inositol 1-dehydrogenase
VGRLTARQRTLGLIGAGRIAAVHAGNAARAGLRLVCVADVVADAARALAEASGSEATDPDTLLAREDIDAVLIATPPDTHDALVVAAAEAGKHVFIEKPLAQTVEGARRAVDTCERAGVVLQVGYNRRFDRNFRAVRDAVRAGRVGDPWILRMSSRDPAPPPGGYLPLSGGLFLDTTSHDLDLARYVIGADILEVTARAASLVDPSAAEIGDVDTAVVSLVFSNGAVGAIDNCRVSAYGYDQRLEVHGSRGMAQAGNELSSTATVADAEGFHAPPLPHFYMERYAPAFARELESFAAALAGAEPEVSGRDGLAAVVAATAAKRALDENRVVRLDETG